VTSIVLPSSASFPGVRVGLNKLLVLIGAIMVQLILGTVYGYSIFWQPLEAQVFPGIMTRMEAGALEARGAAVAPDAMIVDDAATAARERESRIGVLKYAFAICLLSFAISMVFAGRIQDTKGPRFTAVVGGLILGFGFLLAGQMSTLAVFYICHAVLMGAAVVLVLLVFHALTRDVDRATYPVLQYIPFGVVTTLIIAGIALGYQYVSNSASNKVFLVLGTLGLLAGVGIGFAYVSPIAALVKWFPHRKGLVSGVAVAGFGLGAYVFSGRSAIGGVGFIDAHGIEKFFTIHGLIAILTVCSGAMLLRNPPAAETTTGARSATAPPDSNRQELLRSRRFYLVWVMFFSGAMAGLMVIGILKPFAGSQLIRAAESSGGGVDSAMKSQLLLKGATAVGVLALFNAAGRVIWGLISDRIGRSSTMTVMFLCQGVTLLTLTALHSEWTLAAGAACVGFNFGGNFALFPSLTADLFGARNFGANYGWVFTSYGIAGVIGVWAGNTAQQFSGSYFGAFALAAVLCFLSAALAQVIARQRPSPPIAVGPSRM